MQCLLNQSIIKRFENMSHSDMVSNFKAKDPAMYGIRDDRCIDYGDVSVSVYAGFGR